MEWKGHTIPDFAIVEVGCPAICARSRSMYVHVIACNARSQCFHARASNSGDEGSVQGATVRASSNTVQDYLAQIEDHIWARQARSGGAIAYI
jgi:hypothetical protein